MTDLTHTRRIEFYKDNVWYSDIVTGDRLTIGAATDRRTVVRFNAGDDA